MTRIQIHRSDGEVEVALLPHKDGSGWSFINLTKGHICPCRFESREAAMQDLEAQSDVESYQVLESEQDDPLSLEELRRMNGEPVWFENLIKKKCGFWMLAYKDCVCNRIGVADYTDYGKTWLAYRRPPDGQG